MKLEILVGMIGSGKTTYSRRRADEGALVVSHDDLTAMLHTRYRYEQGLRDSYRKMEEAIVRVTMEAGRDAVVDRTHLTRESRERWLRFAAWPSFAKWDLPRIVAVVFPIAGPEVHARRRAACDARGRPYEEWLAVARHHAAQAAAEPLSAAEGFDQIINME